MSREEQLRIRLNLWRELQIHFKRLVELGEPDKYGVIPAAEEAIVELELELYRLRKGIQ